MTYKELTLRKAYRIDLLVDNKIVIETKAVGKIITDYQAQVLTYMKLGNFKTG